MGRRLSDINSAAMPGVGDLAIEPIDWDDDDDEAPPRDPLEERREQERMRDERAADLYYDRG